MDKALIVHFAAALFAILNPLGNLPVFISSTRNDRLGIQRYLALFLSVFVAAMLLVFFWFGTSILDFFGISLPSFRIAGGILLLLGGISMVRGHESKQTAQLAEDLSKESDLDAAKNRFRSILIPVGIPLFVGPGSISTAILFSGQAHGPGEKAVMSLVIGAMALVLLVVLLLGERLGKLMGPMGLDIAARLMGLLLAAIGVQFILSGLGDAFANWFPSIQQK